MTTTTFAPTHLADLRRQARPSREQLRVAAAMFAVASEDVTSVVVPVVVTDCFEYPGGFWLADRSARDGSYAYGQACEAAEAAAEAYLRDGGGDGLPGWVTIRTDGSWSAWDGTSRAA